MPVIERIPGQQVENGEQGTLPILYSVESDNGPHENIVTVAENSSGLFGIFEARDSGDSYAPSRAAGIVRNNLLQEDFNTVIPENSMQNVLVEINTDLKNINSAENNDHALAAAAIKIFKNSSGELQAAFGIAGAMQIYHQTAALGNPNHLVSRAVTPQRAAEVYLSGGDDDALQDDRSATGVVNLTLGDRLLIVSQGVQEGEGPGLHESIIEIESLDRATRRTVQGGAAHLSKAALGVQVGERTPIAEVGPIVAGARGQLPSSPESAGRRPISHRIRDWLGGTALGTMLASRLNRRDKAEPGVSSVAPVTTPYPPRVDAGVNPIIVPNYPPRLEPRTSAVVPANERTGRLAGVQSGWADFRRHYDNAVAERRRSASSKGRLGRIGLLGAAGWAAYEGWDHERRMRWYERQRLHPRYADTTMTPDEIDRDIEQRRLRSVGRVAVGLVAGLILYRLAFDIGDGRNKGIDLMPSFLLPGKNEKGDGWGIDLNWSNRSPMLNDDPTVGHWNSSGAMDLLPSWVDGDPMDPLHWPWTHDSHFQYVPAGSGHSVITHNPGGGTHHGGTPPAKPTTPAPPAPTPAPSPPAPTGTQNAAPIYIEPGSGFDREIQEYAASEGKPISDPQAYRIFLDGRQRFGDNGMVTGVPLYRTPTGDLRFASPGNAHLTAQMEQLIDSSV